MDNETHTHKANMPTVEAVRSRWKFQNPGFCTAPPPLPEEAVGREAGRLHHLLEPVGPTVQDPPGWSQI
eukprot:7437092-Lingulodinium_polyedra.AAC.1